MVATVSGPALRWWASRCKKQASDKWCSREERERLQTAAAALLESAKISDRIAGNRSERCLPPPSKARGASKTVL